MINSAVATFSSISQRLANEGIVVSLKSSRMSTISFNGNGFVPFKPTSIASHSFLGSNIRKLSRRHSSLTVRKVGEACANCTGKRPQMTKPWVKIRPTVT